MELRRSGLRAGVYVDVENTTRNGGRGLRFDVLRDFACRDGADALRLNAYLAYDAERARHDSYYRTNATGFHFAMRSVGFKVIEKPVQWYTNEDGGRVSKANSDLDLAVDMLLQSAKLDRVVLVSGDGDFTQVVRALQNAGCRVELVAFQNVSYELRCEADLFVPGFLIPGLLPQAREPRWGELGSRVRGTCRHYNAERGFGFLRYIVNLDNLTSGDPTGPDSPYRDAFFHFSNMPPGLDRSLLPNRDMIFEFTLVPSQADPAKMAAADIMLVFDYGERRAPVMLDRDRDRAEFRPPPPPPVEREPRQFITDREHRSPVLIERFTPHQSPPAERSPRSAPEPEEDEA
jgi:cold shock CspA family protein